MWCPRPPDLDFLKIKDKKKHLQRHDAANFNDFVHTIQQSTGKSEHIGMVATTVHFIWSNVIVRIAFCFVRQDRT